MSKPLFRFTVGCCHQQGLEVLVESLHRTIAALGKQTFDWLVCHNGLSEENLLFLREQTPSLPVQFYSQNWADCPIEESCQTPRREDGTYEYDGKRCGGTLWKVCPARLRLEAHEVIMDNDIVLLRSLPPLLEFLQFNKVLILEEPIRFYGRYDHLFPVGQPFLNSGLMGLPPGFDFAAEIRKTWQSHGRLQSISQADEQGLLMYTLSRYPSLRIKSSQILEVLARDFTSRITGKELGIHFTQANRIPTHRAWREYQKLSKEIL